MLWLYWPLRILNEVTLWDLFLLALVDICISIKVRSLGPPTLLQRSFWNLPELGTVGHALAIMSSPGHLAILLRLNSRTIEQQRLVVYVLTA